MGRRNGVEESLGRLVWGLDHDDTSASSKRLASLSIKSLIERCLDDGSGALLSEMTEESYKHANGFDKISLPRIPSSPLRARLHIWHPQPCEGVLDTGDAHNHRWPFASLTLVGDLRNDLFGVEHKIDGAYFHYRHNAKDPTHTFRLSQIGRADLVQTDELRTRQGETYFLSPHTVHKVAPEEGEYTATIALELASIRHETDVYAQMANKPTAAGVTPPHFHPEVIRDKLLELYGRC